MSDETFKLRKLTLPDGVAARVGGIRLAPASAGLELVYALPAPAIPPHGPFNYEVQFWAAPLAGGSPVLRASVPELFPGAPSWDCDGKRFIYEQAGGARNALRLHDAAGDRLVNGAARLNGFDQPRFVRGGGGAEMAALLDFTPRRLMVFPDVGVKPRPAIECTAAVLLAHDHGYVCLYKSDLTGAMKGPGVFPGLLHHGWLQPDLSHDGAPSLPLAAAKIYELDAVLHAGRHAIGWVTTELGALAIAGTSTAAGIERLRSRLCALAPTPSWPTVALHGDRVAFAVVAAAGTPAAEVRVAELGVDELLK